MPAPGTHQLADGRTAEVVEVEGGGLRARVSSLGAALLSLWAPDAGGRSADVALGHASLDGYLGDLAYLGVAVGRTAGRIGGAEVTVEGTAHRLDANEGAAVLHGGPCGLSTKVWTVQDRAADRVALSVESPDGEGGYPGRLHVRLEVSLPGDGVLAFDWHAEADAPTPVALTHHAYWNLDGHGAGPVDGHVLWSPAERFLALDGPIPSGEAPPVEGTALDLGRPAPLADVLARGGPVRDGLDHDLLVPPFGRRQAGLRPALSVWNGRGGDRARSVAVWTTEPGVHLYDGSALSAVGGKGGTRYGPRSGLAVETQPPPDATRLAATAAAPFVPSVVVRPGRPLLSRTELRFAGAPASG